MWSGVGEVARQTGWTRCQAFGTVLDALRRVPGGMKKWRCMRWSQDGVQVKTDGMGRSEIGTGQVGLEIK